MDEECSLRILSIAGSDIETWYHLWETTVALNAMCVRAGKRGTAIGLGGCLHFDLQIGGWESGETLLNDAYRLAWEPLHGSLKPTILSIGRSFEWHSCRADLESRLPRGNHDGLSASY